MMGLVAFRLCRYERVLHVNPNFLSDCVGDVGG